MANVFVICANVNKTKPDSNKDQKGSFGEIFGRHEVLADFGENICFAKAVGKIFVLRKYFFHETFRENMYTTRNKFARQL